MVISPKALLFVGFRIDISYRQKDNVRYERYEEYVEGVEQRNILSFGFSWSDSNLGFSLSSYTLYGSTRSLSTSFQTSPFLDPETIRASHFGNQTSMSLISSGSSRTAFIHFS